MMLAPLRYADVTDSFFDTKLHHLISFASCILHVNGFICAKM